MNQKFFDFKKQKDQEEQKIIIYRMLSNRQQRKIRQYQDWDCGFKETSSTDESDSSQESNYIPAKMMRGNPRKQKLQLCKKFMQCGFCPYYARCKFAHGSHQLRKNDNMNMKYKTKECGTFFIDGHCHYGNRCNFLHQQKCKTCVQKSSLVLSKLQNFGIDFIYNETISCNSSRLSKILQ